MERLVCEIYNIDTIQHLDTKSISLVLVIFYSLYQSSFLLLIQINHCYLLLL